MSHPHAPLGEAWKVWRWASLRAPGFSIDKLAPLAAADLARQADGLAELERALEEERKRCLGRLPEAEADAKLRQRIASHLYKRLTLSAELAARPAVAAFVERERQLLTAREAFGESYRAERVRVSLYLREVAAEPRFREAVVWQNRGALRTGLDKLLGTPASVNDSKTRNHERLVAKYLQRYCAKNETFGFFGPIGWARIVDGQAAIRLIPSEQLLAARTTYFEYWGIDAIAESLTAKSDRLLAATAPRLHPTIRVSGTQLHHPIDAVSELPAEYAAVLARCDGVTPAAEIAQRLGSEGFSSEEEVLGILVELEQKGLILWRIEIPTHGFRPERHLRVALERMAPCDERAQALERLDDLERLRDQIARAAGDPAALDAGFEALEKAFVEWTGVDAQRNAGKTYAARTLVFEDCRRGDSLEVGRGLLDRIGPPLALVLASARWFTHEIAVRYRQAFDDVYDRLVAETAREPVDLQRFLRAAKPLFPGGGTAGSIVHTVTAELHARWASLLPFAAGDRAREFSVEDLGAEAAALFAAPGPGWPSARHHSPDLMIAARSSQAILDGDYCPILGEVHVGMNTVANPCDVKEHPSPSEILSARQEDLAPTIAPVWSKNKTSVDFFSISEQDFDLEQSDVISARPREKVLQLGQLSVERTDGQLFVRGHDGGPRFDIIAFFEHHLIAESYSHFSILPSGQPHLPRISLSGMVLSRERWRMEVGPLPFMSLPSAEERYVSVRRWAHDHSLPRRVFVKVPNEVKPFFVDFDSPLLVEMFCANIKTASTVTVTEMHPDVPDCWLEDARGQRYTLELRLAAVDDREWAR